MEAVRFELRSQEGADLPIGQRSSERYLRKARNGHLEQSPNDSGQKGGSGTGKKSPVEQKWDLKERRADGASGMRLWGAGFVSLVVEKEAQ